ncbi:MAG: hypothetical protein V1668_01710 [Patescibacteria group bacterium]
MKRLNIKKNIFRKNLGTFFILGILACVGIAQGGARVAQAEWLEPSSAPPTETFDAPLTTGPENQAKAGSLEILPTYDLTQSSSFSADPPLKPLDVRGDGAIFSTPYVYNDVLAVDDDVLYANSTEGWVGIGTKFQTPDTALIVEGGMARIGSGAAPINGRAVSGYSSKGAGLTAASMGGTGVYGLYTGNSSQAVSGQSVNGNGLKGVSTGGKGIYVETGALTDAAVYGQNTGSGLAGYFKGFFGAGADVAAGIFLPTQLQRSLVPFAAGQKIGEYPASAAAGSNSFLFPDMAFDGSNIWVMNKFSDDDGNELWKIRASDGEVIGTYNLPNTEGTNITFDGRYLWLSNYDATLTKFDPQDGSVTEHCGTVNFGVIPREIATSVDDDGKVFIWTVSPDGGDITKIDSDCNRVGIYPVGTNGAGVDLNRLNSAGWRVRPEGIIFADGYIWTLLPNVTQGATRPATIQICVSGPGCQQNPENLIKIDPDTGAVVGRYATGLSAPGRLIFDGAHIWVISSYIGTEGKVAKFRVSDSQFMPLALSSKLEASDLAFDGTYVWLAGLGEPGIGNSVYRITAANGEIKGYPTRLWSDWSGARLLFDGTYLWTLNTCNSTGCDETRPLNLQKFYSGSGQGHTDLNTVVNLDRLGFCSGRPTRVCKNNSDCEIYGSCNITPQPGHVNVSGAGMVGNNLTVGSDVQAENNQWGGSDEVVPVSSGVANCATIGGKFMTGLTLDANSQITEIICNEL